MKSSIGSLCKMIGSGGTPSRKNKKFYDNGTIRWLKTKELNDKNIFDTEEYITEEALRSSSAKLFPKNTVSMAMYGATVGKLGMLKNECATNQACCNMVADENKADYRFLFYSLLFNRENLINLANGAAQQNLNKGIIENFEINYFKLEEQKAIANILSTLDEKIETNNQINKRLEEMGQSIFKHWFVDFEYPNENGEPYKSSGGEMVESELGMIPKGWEVKSLDEIAEYLNGLAMQKFRPQDDEQSYPVLKIKELRQGVTDDNSDRCSRNIDSRYIITDGDVIFSWSGSLLVEIWCGGKCGLNQHLFKVTSNNYEKWFFYNWTKYHLEKFISIAESKATTMGHIKRKDLSDSKALVPTDDIYSLANSILKPLYEKIIKSKVESKKLSNLRDTLLPKLMSGELRVPLEECDNQ